MGSCLSLQSSSQPSTNSTAKVVTPGGSLREYPTSVMASQVLESESAQSACFLCSSDQLYYNEFIESLPPTHQLQLNQIYFVLPLDKLRSRLTAMEMAELAVKASSAIAKRTKKNGRGRRKYIRVSPDYQVKQRLNHDGVERVGEEDETVTALNERLNEERFGGVKRLKEEKGMVKSGYANNSLQRNASKPRRTPLRPFRSRLSTIQEGTITDIQI